MTVRKQAARLELALSPAARNALEVDLRHIHVIDDDYAPSPCVGDGGDGDDADVGGGGDVDVGSGGASGQAKEGEGVETGGRGAIMTDGCGFISLDLARQLPSCVHSGEVVVAAGAGAGAGHWHQAGELGEDGFKDFAVEVEGDGAAEPPVVPVAFQVRLFCDQGAFKGMLIVRADVNHGIYLRRSMLKLAPSKRWATAASSTAPAATTAPPPAAAVPALTTAKLLVCNTTTTDPSPAKLGRHLVLLLHDHGSGGYSSGGSGGSSSGDSNGSSIGGSSGGSGGGSGGGVPENVFRRLLRIGIDQRCAAAMATAGRGAGGGGGGRRVEARALLLRRGGECTSAVAAEGLQMLAAGHDPATEPYLRRIIHAEVTRSLVELGGAPGGGTPGGGTPGGGGGSTRKLMVPVGKDAK
jgi:hypothetical protein